MDLRRHGEQSHTLFRTRRFFSVNGQWYFDTREGEQYGPFQNKHEAKKALAVFVAKGLRGLNGSMPPNTGLRHGSQDGIEYMVDELLKYFLFRNNYGQTTALAYAQLRLKELKKNRTSYSNVDERMDSLIYAIDQE